VPKVELHDVTLGFGKGATRALALDRVSVSLDAGPFTVISGPSGSGKTSLLASLGGIITPDSGRIIVDGTDIMALDSKARSTFRREKTGYVFQLFRLMPALNAEQNIRLSLEVRRIRNDRQRALEALEMVGMLSKAHLRPNQMSGGEQQRVAIARAVAHRPMILLADEPTASLDTANGVQVTKLLMELAEGHERIVVAVTHDPRVMSFAQRNIQMQDGNITRA
jgi:putative ABC transport system ATP-binding protein